MKRVLSIMISMALCIAAGAQGSMRVNVPNLVAVDEQFNVTFVIEGEGHPSDFNWQVGDDFQLVWGPQKGTSSSINILNGKRTQSSQTTYTYVLMPRKTGTFQIPAATATLKGKHLESKSVSVQVVSNGASSSRQGSASGQKSSETGTVANEDIFLKLSLSKSKAVVGETITAVLKLYQRVNVAGFEDAKFPTFNGFWSQEVQAPTNIEFHRENIGDNIFNAAVLRSWTLIPQQAGDITIEPAELVCLVNVRAPRSSSNSIFDSFFQDDYRTIRKRLTTPAATVHVSKVPAGAPASFGGGVGNFSMKTALTRDSLKTHDAASLKITISGKGNIALLEAPKVSFPPDFELYDIKTTDAAGSRTFEYPFIPRSYGEFQIGPIEYSYYDVSSGKYVTLRSDEMQLKVARGAETEPVATGGQLVSNPNRRDVKNLGSDIRFIATAEPHFAKKDSFFVWSPTFFIIIAVLILMACIVFFCFRTMEHRRADVVGSRNRAAGKMARKRLSQAGIFLSKDLTTAFYEELHKTLLGFVADKLNMNVLDMNKENIAEQLQANGVSKPLSEQFLSLLDACEYARYAPSEGHEAMKSHYESAVDVISMIDESMRRKKKAPVAPIIAMLLLASPFAAQAQDTASDWTIAAAAYADGRYEEALESWNRIVSSGVESAELYYNIGNACFKLQDNAHAVIAYERALKLNPSYADARFNLEYANSLLQDKIDTVPEFFLKTWNRKICWLLGSDAWAWISIVLFALALAMLLLFLLGNRNGVRKTGFFCSIAALLLSVACLVNASWQRSDALASDQAVVVRAVVSAKSAPASTTNLFVLHEGTKVRILEELGEWLNIELSDGRQAWIKSSEVEVI